MFALWQAGDQPTELSFNPEERQLIRKVNYHRINLIMTVLTLVSLATLITHWILIIFLSQGASNQSAITRSL